MSENMDKNITFKEITSDGMLKVENWCRDTDADFLRQWTGRHYVYPITAEKMKKRLDEGSRIFELKCNDEIAGTIEIVEENSETKSAHIGCFLINPELHGKGYGKQAIEAVKKYLRDRGMKAITLCVFEYNKGAVRCYEKAGFITSERQEREGCFALFMRCELI